MIENIWRILIPLNYTSLTQKVMKYKRILENRFRWQTLFVDNKYGNDNERIIKLQPKKCFMHDFNVKIWQHILVM